MQERTCVQAGLFKSGAECGYGFDLLACWPVGLLAGWPVGAGVYLERYFVT